MKSLVKKLYREVYGYLPTTSQLKARFSSFKSSSIESWCQLADVLISMIEELKMVEEVKFFDLPENKLNILRKEYDVICDASEGNEIKIYKDYMHRFDGYLVSHLIGKLIINRELDKISASIGNSRYTIYQPFKSVESALVEMIKIKENEINRPKIQPNFNFYSKVRR
jgi:hypothetical protein